MTNLFILSLTICVTLALSGTVPKDSQGNGRCHEDIACEGGVLNLACPAGSVMHIAEANYGRTLPDAQMCPYGKQHNDITSCHATNSKSVVSRACEGQASCSVASKNGVFGDPCGGTYKYLRVQYCCDFPKPNHCVERIACEPLGLKLECPRRSVIHVEAANYGRTLPDAQVCPYGSSHNDVTNCFATSSMSEVTNACEGKSSCDVPSGNGVFGDPCLGTYKYLQVNYCCNVHGNREDVSQLREKRGTSVVAEVVRIALGYEGSTKWALATPRRVCWKSYKDANKCNIFVADMFKEAGGSVPNRRGWCYSPIGANEWANNRSTYLTNNKCWALVSTSQPGDVAGYAGHVGIVTGTELTTSASVTGQVVENDWGFRKGNIPVFWRYTC